MKLKNLKNNFLGKNNFYYEKIDSTQKEIWRRIENNTIKNGTLVMAEIQNSGIGTHGRKWYTEVPNNIAFSFYIEANCNLEKLNGITIQIAEILKDIFYRFYNINLEIKEPNDLYYNGRKVGGILTESKILGDKLRFLVIGIGINTSQTNFNDEIKEIATSIKNEFNIEISADDVIVEFCNCFETAFLERIKD